MYLNSSRANQSKRNALHVYFKRSNVCHYVFFLSSGKRGLMRRYGFSVVLQANRVANMGDHTHVMVHQEIYLHFFYTSVVVIAVQKYQT